ncbi:ATP-binding protein [Accumulibacter sp.]|uniref:AAA family ATPase n=1 Tax=Accumulibacter sp. TaxID=2053492 RepID=UPI002622263B|nr:ATP-binding protein [Accumulibacter sp.]
MLIEFGVANFRSIRTRQKLSMVASPDATHLQRNVSPGQNKELRLLRSAVIYGANAAGKSNLLRAVETFRQLVQNSATGFQEGYAIPVTPFLFAEEASCAEPSEFEIIFTADDGVRYHYSCAASSERVFKEWLVAYPRGRAQRWFEREYDAGSKAQRWWFGPNFSAERAERKVWHDFTRDNALFLSTAIQLNNAQLRPVFNWITQKLIVLVPGVVMNPFLSLNLLRDVDEHEQIMRFMRAADIGIDRLELLEEDSPSAPAGKLPPGAVRLHFEIGLPSGSSPQTPKRLRVLAWHKRADSREEVALDIDQESDGTQKLFEFSGGWLRALEWGATLLVDELDRSLHPHITRFLVGLFHSRKNDKNAQLVFTTHDTTLLDTELLRRDQIWFVEKDKQGSSSLYSLLEYSPRKDEALERGYLKGRYGAIPFIGSIAG